MLKRADPPRATAEVKRLLQDSISASGTCAAYSTRRFRFRASITLDKVVFNEEVAVDLVWLEGRPVLHLVDTHTHLQGAAMLRSKNADYIWSAFMEYWVSLHLGYPHLVRVGHESTMSSDVFRRNAAVNGIVLQFSGIERHSSLGAGDSYQAPLRRVFSVLRTLHPSLHADTHLRLSLKGMNDTMGPHGLDPRF